MNNKYFIEYLKEVNTLEPMPKVKVMKLKVIMKRQIEDLLFKVIIGSCLVYTLWIIASEIMMKWRLI